MISRQPHFLYFKAFVINATEIIKSVVNVIKTTALAASPKTVTDVGPVVTTALGSYL